MTSICVCIFVHILVMQEYLYPYGTIIFTITCTTFWIYLYYYLPETKGQSEEHITNKFKNSNVEKATLTWLGKATLTWLGNLDACVPLCYIFCYKWNSSLYIYMFL